jgi:threonine dehydrogenase-like Zn-dependent dehydrogenase
MKAVVFHGMDDVPQRQLEQSMEVIIRITAPDICRTDLQMIRATLSGVGKLESRKEEQRDP